MAGPSQPSRPLSGPPDDQLVLSLEDRRSCPPLGRSSSPTTTRSVQNLSTNWSNPSNPADSYMFSTATRPVPSF